MPPAAFTLSEPWHRQNSEEVRGQKNCSLPTSGGSGCLGPFLQERKLEGVRAQELALHGDLLGQDKW